MAEEKKVKLSDPCQVPIKDPITKEKRICGEVHPTLAHHLKKHKKPNGKRWTSAEYKKTFPQFSMGTPPQIKPETKAKFLAAASNRNALIAKEEEKQEKEELQKPTAATELEEKVLARFNELWDQVNRDVAAKQFALEAARCEQRLEHFNKQYDRYCRMNDHKKMNDLTELIAAQQKMLKDQMTFLDLSMKNRREKNQLGNDSVAQLVSNFGGTLRRYSPEKQEIFMNRVRDVMNAQKARLYEKTLADLTDEKVEEVETQPKMTESDLDDTIAQYIAKGIV